MNIITLTAAILPAILLLIYVWKRDPQPEPTSWLTKAVLSGIAICIPATIIELGIEVMLFGMGGQPSSLADTTAMAFFVAALPEESLKLLVLWLILRKNPFFDEHFDGIVYAVCIGLGFAAIENVMYLFNEEEWLYTAITRALLAVPSHYIFAILMGYYYSIYHFVNHSPKIAVCILLVPVAAHGFYDALALSGLVDHHIGSVCFFVLIFLCIKMHKVARNKILALVEKDHGDNASVS